VPAVSQPDTLARTIADLTRRVQILEATQRVGLSRVRFAWSTHTGTPRITAADVWENGPAGTTWEADDGTTGTGYPEVTLQFGRKALFFARVQGLDYSNDAAYKVGRLTFGVGIDGTDPTVWPTTQRMYSSQSRGPVTEGNVPNALIAGRNDIAPGVHTIKWWARWVTQAGGATMPYASDIFLAVIPID
jgi:hypothetical protein